MRAMWKGTISFGLVTIPVKMYGATSTHDISFRQVRRSDGSRVKYKRVAEADGEVVDYGEIAKGYELPDGRMVVLTDDDMEELPLPTKKVVDVLEFVPLEQIDPIFHNKSYYLEPDTNAGLKPYLLLREALEASDMVAVVKVTIGTREQLATIRVREDVLTLSTLMWADEIRKPEFSFLGEDVQLRPQEIKMAQSLVASMEADFDPEQYHDEYEVALDELVAAKLEGNEVVQPAVGEGAEQPDNVVDLMSALQASIDRAKKGEGEAVAGVDADEKGEADGADEKPAKKAAAKKGSTKKAPAKKTTEKKTAAKKTTAKKTPAKKPAAKKTAAKKAS